MWHIIILKMLKQKSYFLFPLSCPVMPSPQFFDGQALISWSEMDITVAVPWYMGLMFRTRQPAGTLMQVNAGAYSTINLMVRYSISHIVNKCKQKRHRHHKVQLPQSCHYL